jgi:multiple sugar transport system permease protein
MKNAVTSKTSKKNLSVSNLIRKSIMLLVVLLFMLPLIWLAYSAFIAPDAILANKNPLTPSWSWANFVALKDENLFKPLETSLLASSLVVFFQLLLALPAAYALRAGTPLLGIFLFALSVPAELLLIPLYGLLQSLHLLGSPLALVVPFLSSPFTVFLLYQALVKLPWAYVEAARIDGASELRIMYGIIGPLLRPEMAAAGVIAFAGHWNLVLFPKVVAGDTYPTVQVALAELTSKAGNNWGLLGAAALLTSLPIVILYFSFEKHVVKTFEGGLK